MSEFFNGWRRKIGCVTLVMACAVAGVWYRSYVVADIISCTALDPWFITVRNGEVAWTRTNLNCPVGARMACDDTQLWATTLSTTALSELRPKFSGRGAYSGVESTIAIAPNARPTFSIFWVNLGLTLLSAYLILWKPRTKPKEQSNA